MYENYSNIPFNAISYECNERLLSSESGHWFTPLICLLPTQSGRSICLQLAATKLFWETLLEFKDSLLSGVPMLRNVLVLFLVFSLTPHAQADYKSAKAAYEAGDYETALEILIPLAAAGDANAQNSLGVMYERGSGVQQSYAEAIKWYGKAAEQGSAKAQTNLGSMYEGGFGVQQDYAEAIKWFRKAAEQGLASAQTNLGLMYFKELGVQQDYAVALKWFVKAAEQGDAYAQHNLGFMYFKGLRVPQDAIKAYAWNELAIAGGHKPSQNARGMIGAKLNATQLKKARKLTKELSEKYGNKTKN